ncbi:MAG TPA: polysaccharide ABC transporter ATP-binding protein [Vicinamibacterales bacterium]|nr:polysaccharide ABC transporter ATP-binding protein [Vicinamibacterales bacterium]
MAAPGVIFDSVSKKFTRGEQFSSLRDLIPAMVGALVKRPSTEQLEKQEFWALKDVSFEVKPGEALGIIGPNGAGKSTALKVLTRILRPDRGQSVVRGRVGALVEIAAGFHADLTGRENVYMQGAIMGMKRAEITKKFDEIVDFAGVEEFIDTPVKRYSSGMNARLGFAVAAHLDPEVLLIDEVLSVGDLAFQDKCYERMQRFARSGIAIVFVSHNLSAISSLCTRVLVMRHGEVETLAPTHEALTVYAGLMQQRREGKDARHELLLKLTDAVGRPISEVDAGGRVRVHVAGHTLPPAELYQMELQVRHLESGTVIYRCGSPNAGAPPIPVPSTRGIDAEWLIDANLGRGHYAVTCALQNERQGWVAVSNPGLLTVNERITEHAIVHLDARCSIEAVDIERLERGDDDRAPLATGAATMVGR